MVNEFHHRGHRGKRRFAAIVVCLLGFLCVLCGEIRSRSAVTQTSNLALPQEKYLRNLKQLTFGGENAEAYFSSDGKKVDSAYLKMFREGTVVLVLTPAALGRLDAGNAPPPKEK